MTIVSWINKPGKIIYLFIENVKQTTAFIVENIDTKLLFTSAMEGLPISAIGIDLMPGRFYKV